MKTVICIVGKSASGKTTLANKLESEYGIPQVESYTTRPRRYEGEKGHIFVESGTSNSVVAFLDMGGYQYWTTQSQFEADVQVYVVDPKGAQQVKKNLPNHKVIIVGVICDEEERLQRMLDRDGVVSAFKRYHSEYDTFYNMMYDYYDYFYDTSENSKDSPLALVTKLGVYEDSFTQGLKKLLDVLKEIDAYPCTWNCVTCPHDEMCDKVINFTHEVRKYIGEV